MHSLIKSGKPEIVNRYVVVIVWYIPSSTGWRTAVYSTLHKVVSPGEFLIIKQESAND
jgi:hypothetical protein